MPRVAKLTASIQADIANFESNLKKARTDLNNTGRSLRDTMGRMERDMGMMGTAMQKVTSIGSKLQSTLGALGVGIGLGSITNDVIGAALQFDRLNTQLKFVTGNQAEATREMEYLRAITNDLGLEFNSTANAYAKFAAASKGTALQADNVRAIFEAVAKSSVAMQLSADDTSGVFLALGQMIGKGTVQAEELRGQLGERLPGAFQIAARAMGVGTAELGKMLESGEVMADEFLPRFAAEMEKTFGAAAADAMQSTTAQINRAKNAWNDLLVTVGTSDAVVTFMQDLTRGAQESGKQVDAVAGAFSRVKSAIAEAQLESRLIIMEDVGKRLAQAQADFASGLVGQNRLDQVKADYDEIRDSVAALRTEILGLKSDAEHVPADPWLKGALERTRSTVEPVASGTGTDSGTSQVQRDADAVAERIGRLQFELAQLGRTEIDQQIATNLQGIKPTPDQILMIEDITRKISTLKEVARIGEGDLDRAVGLLNQGVADYDQATEEALDGAVAKMNEGIEAFDRASQAGTEFRDIARDAAGTLFTGFSEAVNQADNLKESLLGLGRTLASLFINKSAGMLLDALLPSLPGLATGGPGDGLTIVGERGPEIVNLPAGSYVNPAARSSAMLRQMVPQSMIGGASGVVINASITVNGSAGTGEQNRDLAEQMAQEFERSARRLVKEEIANQQRTGGLLNPRAAGY